jgi:hypothetical protein
MVKVLADVKIRRHRKKYHKRASRDPSPKKQTSNSRASFCAPRMAKKSGEVGSSRCDDLGGTPQGAAQRAVPAKSAKPSALVNARGIYCGDNLEQLDGFGGMETRALTAKDAKDAKSFLEIRSDISRGSHQAASVRRGKVRKSG